MACVRAFQSGIIIIISRHPARALLVRRQRLLLRGPRSGGLSQRGPSVGAACLARRSLALPLAEALSVPLFIGALVPLLPTALFPPVQLAASPLRWPLHRLHLPMYRFQHAVASKVAAASDPCLLAFQRAAGVPGTPKRWAQLSLRAAAVGLALLYSPALCGPLPPDWDATLYPVLSCGPILAPDTGPPPRSPRAAASSPAAGRRRGRGAAPRAGVVVVATRRRGGGENAAGCAAAGGGGGGASNDREEESGDVSVTPDVATRLEAFLAARSAQPPLYVGFGCATLGARSGEVFCTVVRMLMHGRLRAVVQAGWASLGSDGCSSSASSSSAGEPSPELLAYAARNVFELGPSVPHAWLFPRCAVVVHHGGSGTTHAAAAAGIPQVRTVLHDEAYASVLPLALSSALRIFFVSRRQEEEPTKKQQLLRRIRNECKQRA